MSKVGPLTFTTFFTALQEKNSYQVITKKPFYTLDCDLYSTRNYLHIQHNVISLIYLVAFEVTWNGTKYFIFQTFEDDYHYFILATLRICFR